MGSREEVRLFRSVSGAQFPIAIGSDKRISQYLFGRADGLMRKNLFSDYRELHVLDVRLLYSPLTGYGEITSR